jgi:hypothetical protein
METNPFDAIDPVAVETEKPVANPFDRFDNEADAGDPGLGERWRLNETESYYRGTLRGSSALSTMATIVKMRNEGAADDDILGKVAHPFMGMSETDFATPQEYKSSRSKWVKDRAEEYGRITTELARYDAMKPWGDTLEAGAALTGVLAGGLQSPESFLGAGAKGASWLARTAKAGLQQAGIMGVADPLVQSNNIDAQVQEHFEPTRTVGAMGVGFVIGGGLHLATGELIPAIKLRRTIAEAASEDPSFRRADIAPEATPEPPPVAAGESKPVPGPEAAPAPEPAPAGAAESAGGALVQKEIPFPEVKLNDIPETGGQQAFVLSDRGVLHDVSNVEGGHLRAIGEMAEKDGIKVSGTTEDGKPVLADGEVYISAYQADRGLVNVTRYGDSLSFNVVEGALTPQQFSAIKRMANKFGGEEKVLFTVEDRQGKEVLLTQNAADLGSYVSRPTAPSADLALASRQSGGSLSMERSRPDTGIAEAGQGTATFQSYHGTDAKFDNFDLSKAGQRGDNFGYGIHLTDSPEIAKTYGENVITARVSVSKDHLLNWDAPLNQQSAYVKAALGKFAKSSELASDFYESISPQSLTGGRSTKPEASSALRDLGIPGIHYQENGVSNYVIFDEKLVRRSTDTGTAVATVPEAQAPKDIAIRSLQQQSMDFAKAIDFPLRQGRITMNKALGIYKTGSGVVRVKEVPDFEVVAHEGGHAIEAKVGKDLTDLTNHYIGELGPLDYDPSLQRANEGFAEFVRRYIGNPAHAEQVAPGFTIAFRDFMDRKAPDIMKAIDEAGAAYRAYLEAPSVDAVGAVRRSVRRTAEGLPRQGHRSGQRGWLRRDDQDSDAAFLHGIA